MSTHTPKGLLNALDLITSAPPERVRALGTTRGAHLQHVRALLESPNVVGVGISEKTADGETTGELSICFYVNKKLARRRLKGDAMVPPLVTGTGTTAYLTDVKEIGTFRLHGAGALKSGASVSHAKDPAGTLGAIVKKGNRSFILSNSHVLALSGKAQVGDPVISPGRTDGGTLPNALVARLSAFVAFSKVADNEVDAAIAEIVPAHLPDVQAAVPHLRSPVKVVAATRGMEVTKFGKATGETTAHVIDVNFHLVLPYPHSVGLVRFARQVLCTHFAENGDSGSLVVDVAGGGVVGLHFAGTDAASVCNPMGSVVNALGFSFAA